MNIGILGTGVVGRTLAEKIAALGHEVVIGTRDVERLLDRDIPPDGTTFGDWLKRHERISVSTFDEAAIHGEIVINATSAGASIEALRIAGEPNLAEKIVIDLCNPLDFSQGFPRLRIVNDDSMGEQIQREFPRARVVKTLNTVNSNLMVAPHELDDGHHTVFVCGNDEAARRQVAEILLEWFGWTDVIDLGDITSSRAVEMLLPLWIRLYDTFDTSQVAFRIVRRE